VEDFVVIDPKAIVTVSAQLEKVTALIGRTKNGANADFADRVLADHRLASKACEAALPK
jgi:hypothetical protein